MHSLYFIFICIYFLLYSYAFTLFYINMHSLYFILICIHFILYSYAFTLFYINMHFILLTCFWNCFLIAIDLKLICGRLLSYIFKRSKLPYNLSSYSNPYNLSYSNPHNLSSYSNPFNLSSYSHPYNLSSHHPIRILSYYTISTV